MSHRTPRTVAALWVVAGGLVFGWWALFGLHGYQSWPIVAIELCIPVAAVAGGFVGTERGMPHVPRKVMAVVLIAVVVLPLGLFAVAGTSTSSGSQTPQAVTFQMSDLHHDSVARTAPAIWLPEGSLNGSGWTSSDSSGTKLGVSFAASESGVPPAAVLANWHDFRFEAWHLEPFTDSGPAGVVDTHYSTPFAVQQASPNGLALEASFHLDKMPSARYWEVFLTAVAPNGVRYLLDDCGGGLSIFNGSVWDWLTAPQ